MVSSDGFYKMSRLYVTPDSFFFKVRLLVLDTYKCSKPCPDIKLGTRYIVMGQIYHRRRHLPNDLLTLLGGKLKPGDGLLRSSNYVKRFNKRRHQKALEATRSRCRDQREGIRGLKKQQQTPVEKKGERGKREREREREKEREGAQGLCLSRERLIFLTLIMCPR
uniref:Chromosome 17 open reading frame 58 n=1 Tax=Lates calcarifer TaxID=8187 RepID=A0A4W6FVL7_LATCA